MYCALMSLTMETKHCKSNWIYSWRLSRPVSMFIRLTTDSSEINLNNIQSPEESATITDKTSGSNLTSRPRPHRPEDNNLIKWTPTVKVFMNSTSLKWSAMNEYMTRGLRLYLLIQRKAHFRIFLNRKTEFFSIRIQPVSLEFRDKRTNPYTNS